MSTFTVKEINSAYKKLDELREESDRLWQYRDSFGPKETPKFDSKRIEIDEEIRLLKKQLEIMMPTFRDLRETSS